MNTENVEARLWSRVQKTDSCWIWQGNLSAGGRYGMIRVGRRRSKLVHVLTWELMNGAVPDGLELDHLCRNRRCVNPVHLEPVTHAENMRRGINATRTHCLRGHPDPLAVTRFGRICRECRREDNRAYRRRHGMVKAA